MPYIVPELAPEHPVMKHLKDLSYGVMVIRPPDSPVPEVSHVVRIPQLLEFAELVALDAENVLAYFNAQRPQSVYRQPERWTMPHVPDTSRCVKSPVSSRICERGVKGCITDHGSDFQVGRFDDEGKAI